MDLNLTWKIVAVHGWIWANEMKEACNVVLYTTYPSSNLIQTQHATMTALFGSLKFGCCYCCWFVVREKNYLLKNTAEVVLNICVRSSICVRDRLEMHQDQMKLGMKERYMRRRRPVNTTCMLYGPGPSWQAISMHALALCLCLAPTINNMFVCWFQSAQISQPIVFSSHKKPAPANPNQHQHQPANTPHMYTTRIS